MSIDINYDLYIKSGDYYYPVDTYGSNDDRKLQDDIRDLDPDKQVESNPDVGKQADYVDQNVGIYYYEVPIGDDEYYVHFPSFVDSRQSNWNEWNPTITQGASVIYHVHLSTQQPNQSVLYLAVSTVDVN